MDKAQLLLANKDRLSKIIEKYPVPMVIVNADSNVDYFNNKFTETFGYTIDDISTGEQWWNTVYPDKEYREKVRTAWEAAVEEAVNNDSQIATQDWDMVCKDGSIRHVEFDLTPIDDGAVISMNDITEARQAADTLRYSENRYRTLVENFPISVVIADINDNIEYLNKKFTESYGYVLEDISPAEKWWNAAYPDPEYRKKVQKGWRKAIEEAAYSGQQIKTQEWEIRCKDGSTRHILFDMSPVDNCSIVTLNDITALKNAENESRELAAKWTATFEAMSSSVCIIDNNGNILECNSATLKMFNISENDIKKQHCWELVHGLVGPIENCPIVRMKKSNKRESTIFKQDNRILEVTVDPIFNEKGETISAVHVVTDITPKRQIE